MLGTGFGPKPKECVKQGSWLYLLMWLVCERRMVVIYRRRTARVGKMNSIQLETFWFGQRLNVSSMRRFCSGVIFYNTSIFNSIQFPLLNSGYYHRGYFQRTILIVMHAACRILFPCRSLAPWALGYSSLLQLSFTFRNNIILFYFPLWFYFLSFTIFCDLCLHQLWIVADIPTSKTSLLHVIYT